MKVYLVDFENVKSKGLTGVDSLNEYDRVIIFYSENADTISFEMHQKVMMSKAEVEYFKVHVGGKNALDFQLSTLLGYLVGTKAYSHLFVISNDKCFDFLHDFWHGKYIASPDCVVYRTRTIAAAINYSSTSKKVAEDDDGDIIEVAESTVTAEEKARQAAVKAAVSGDIAPEELLPLDDDDVMDDFEPEEIKAVVIPPAAKADKPAEKAAEKAEEPKEKAAKKHDEKPEAHKPLNDSELFEQYLRANSAKPAAETKKNEEKAEAKAEVEEKPLVQAEKITEEKAEPEKKAEPEENGGVKEEKAEKAEKAEEKAAANKQAKPKQPKQTKTQTLSETLREALKAVNATPEQAEKIEELLIQSETKEDFHNGLAKEFKQLGKDFYKPLRPKFLRLKDLYYNEHPELKPLSDETPNKLHDVRIIEEKPEDTESSEAAEAAEQVQAEEKKDEPEIEVAAEAEAAKEAQAEPETKAEIQEETKAETKAEAKSEKKPARTRKKPKAAKAKDPRLAELLNGLCDADELEQITELFNAAETRQKLYIRMVKLFKKDRGCKFYNAIKAEYALRNG